MANIRVPMNFGEACRVNGIAYGKVYDAGVSVTGVVYVANNLWRVPYVAHGLVAGCGVYLSISGTGGSYSGTEPVYSVIDADNFYVMNITGIYIGHSSSGICKKTQPSVGQATDSIEDGDATGYADYTWYYDDNGRGGGGAHRIWTACQMAVCNLPVNCHDVYAGEPVNEVYRTLSLITVTRSGVLRVWHDYRERGAIAGYIYINDVYVGTTEGGQSNAVPYRLIAGDVVTAATKWVKSLMGVPGYNVQGHVGSVFLPYTWP